MTELGRPRDRALSGVAAAALALFVIAGVRAIEDGKRRVFVRAIAAAGGGGAAAGRATHVNPVEAPRME